MNSNLPPIIATCLVCGKQEYHPVTTKGWRLASNRIGGYTCSETYDNVIEEYDKQQKELKKNRKLLKSIYGNILCVSL